MHLPLPWIPFRFQPQDILITMDRYSTRIPPFLTHPQKTGEKTVQPSRDPLHKIRQYTVYPSHSLTQALSCSSATKNPIKNNPPSHSSPHSSPLICLMFSHTPHSSPLILPTNNKTIPIRIERVEIRNPRREILRGVQHSL